MTHNEALEIMKQKGWCYQPRQANTGWNRVMVGPRLNTEAYGPFPSGFVTQVVAEGDGLIEAVEKAVSK